MTTPMGAFRDLPIRHKLTVLLSAIVSVVLLLTTTAIVLTGVQTTKRLMVNQYTTLANVLAANSAAALSVDPALTQQLLSDLRAEPTIVFAATYDATGNIAASYKAENSIDFQAPQAESDGHRFTGDGHLEVFKSVLQDGQPLGTIYLRATTQQLTSQVWHSLQMVLGFLAIAICLAVLLSYQLQRLISGPILRLVDATQMVSAESDFSVRVEKQGRDELGTLYDAFNAMLAQIQERDAELERHGKHLEELVHQRTESLRAKTQALEVGEQQMQQQAQQLARTNAELARSNGELEQFAYIASHDLQEPLRKVQAFGDMLASRYGDALGDEGRDFVSRMQSAVARMKSLINDLLLYSRVTTKARPFAAVDLSAVAKDVITDLETRIKDTGGLVEIDPLPTLDAEPTQMRQLLQNLIGNALKYRRPDVPPMVKVSSRELQPNGAAGSVVSATELVYEITVQDNGIGFDEKYLHRLFKPFERLHGRGQYEGTGIGLAVCRKIVERHRGTITAKAVPGEGATFIVTLPRRQ